MQQRLSALEHRQDLLRASTGRRTTEICGLASFVGPSRGSQALSDGFWSPALSFEAGCRWDVVIRNRGLAPALPAIAAE